MNVLEGVGCCQPHTELVPMPLAACVSEVDSGAGPAGGPYV